MVLLALVDNAVHKINYYGNLRVVKVSCHTVADSKRIVIWALVYNVASIFAVINYSFSNTN